jgi:hypothetical protein
VLFITIKMDFIQPEAPVEHIVWQGRSALYKAAVVVTCSNGICTIKLVKVMLGPRLPAAHKQSPADYPCKPAGRLPDQLQRCKPASQPTHSS